MAGDDRHRFCKHCQLHVHNLSDMSAAEREELLTQRNERMCVAYVANDRAVPVPVGAWLLLQRLLRSLRAGIALVTLLLPVGPSGCATSTPQPCPPPRPGAYDNKQVREFSDGKLYVGGISGQRPLWRRILFFWW